MATGREDVTLDVPLLCACVSGAVVGAVAVLTGAVDGRG